MSRREESNRKGEIAESATRAFLSHYAKAIGHDVNANGLDLVGVLFDGRSFCAEIINWTEKPYNDKPRFINSYTWQKKIKPLISSSYAVKLFVCYGVSPNAEQCDEAYRSGITILFYPHQLLHTDRNTLNIVNETLQEQIDAAFSQNDDFIKKILNKS